MNRFVGLVGKIMARAFVVTSLLLTTPASSAQDPLDGSPIEKSRDLNPEKRKRLQTKMLPLAEGIFKIVTEDYQVGKSDVQTIFRWSKRIMEIQYQLAETKAKKKDAVIGHLKRLKLSLPFAKALYRVGKTAQTDVLILQYFIAEAEVTVMQENEN